MNKMETLCKHELKQPNSSFYESHTSFSFDSHDPHLPTVCASGTHSGFTCIALETNVNLFNDEDCSEVFTNDIGDTVQRCCLVEDGKILLVASKRGDIYCYNQEELLFIRAVPLSSCSRGCNVADIITGIKVEDPVLHSVLIIGCFGDVYKLSWPVGMRSESADEERVELNCLREGKPVDEVLCAVEIPSIETTVALLGRNICVWSSIHEETCSLSNFNLTSFVKARMWRGRFLVALTHDEKLVVFCPQSFVCCALWEEIPVQDFVFHGEEPHQCILILSQSSDSESKVIILASLPDFEVKWKCETSPALWLVDNASKLIYLEGVLVDGYFKRINFNIIQEGSPQEKLKELIREKKLEEAEAFARRYSLGIEAVLKEKALLFVEALAVEADETTFAEFLTALDGITDYDFLSDIFLNFFLHDLRHMKSLLRYGEQRMKSIQCSEAEEMHNIRCELASRLFKLETYELVRDQHTKDAKYWKKVFSLDWLKFCCKLLEEGDVRKALFVWNRHLKCRPLLTKERITTLLNSLSPYEESEIFSWLQSLVSYIICKSPGAVICLLAWAFERTRTLEKQDGWPSNGIEFWEKLCDLIEQSVTSGCHKMIGLAGNPKERVTPLLNHLKEIQVLKDTYQDNKLEVARCILKEVPLQDIDRVVDGFMKHFVCKYQLDMDQVFLSFVQKHLMSITSCWSALAATHWEPIIAVYISHIKCLQKKLECIIETLRLASVPWSETVTALASEGLQINLPEAAEIKKLKKCVDIKLVFKKYSFTPKLIECLKQRRRVFHFLVQSIMHRGTEAAMKDALTLADDSLDLQIECYCLSIDSHLLKGNEEQALHVLQALEGDAFVECCKRLICRLEAEVDENLTSRCISLLNAVFVRLERIPNLRGDVENVRNIHRLTSEFDCTIKYQDYCDERKRRSILTFLIRRMVENCNDTDNDLAHLFNRAKKLATYLQLPSGDGPLEVCEQFLEMNKSFKLKNVEGSMGNFSEKLLSVSKKMLSVNLTHSSFLTLFELIRQHFLQHYISVDDPWLQLLPLLNRCHQQAAATAISTQALNMAKLLSVFQCGQGGSLKPVLDVLPSLYVSLEQKDQMDVALRKLPLMVDYSLSENMFSVILALLNICLLHMKAENNSSGVAKVTEFAKMCSDVWLSKAISARYFDAPLALSILFSMECTNVLWWLRQQADSLKGNFPSLQRISRLGMMYCNQFALQDDFISHLKLNTEAAWAKKLSHMNITCDSSFTENKSSFVKKILLHCDGDVYLAEEFCMSFEIDFQSLLLECLEAVVLSWEPVLETSVDAEGKNVVKVKNNEDGTVKKCLAMAQKVENKDELEKCLSDILGNLNYYFYEMYLCVDTLKKELLQSVSSPRHLLIYLKNYRRIRPVEAEEKEVWLKKFPDSPLPLVADFRLPFWQHDIEAALKPELTMDNYEPWLKVAPFLNLSETFIITVAIHQTVDELNARLPDEGWCANERCGSRITQIWNCVRQMTNLEAACAALFYVAKKMKPGADQVMLYKYCYRLTKEWAEGANTPTAVECLKTVTKKYYQLSSCQILHLHKLDCSHYLNAVANPSKLIKELYQDKRILDEHMVSGCPDINAAAKAIAKVHSFPLIDLYMKLLREWLCPLGGGDRFDETVTIRGTFQDLQKQSQEENNNFVRACYLMRSPSRGRLAQMLIDMAFDEEENVLLQLKKNALLCVMNVMSAEDIFRLSQKSHESVMLHLQHLTFTQELRGLGYLYTLKQFKGKDKQELVVALLQDDSRNPLVLQKALHLALTFQVRTPNVWKALLKALLQQRLFADIEEVLGQIPELPEPELVEAWNQIVLLPFNKCVPPLSEEQEAACMRSLHLVEECPVVGQLDVGRLARACVDAGKAHWATLLIFFMHGAEQKLWVKEISGRNDFDDIILRLEELESAFLFVPKVCRILKES